jgi:hypothetical protein
MRISFIFTITLALADALYLSFSELFQLGIIPDLAQPRLWESAVPSHLTGMTCGNDMLGFCGHYIYPFG